MNGTYYKVEDLKNLSIQECAEKYGVSPQAVLRAKNRRGIYSKKIKILITTPYEQRVAKSIQECANMLELSRASILKALKGQRVATLENLEIKVEVYINGEEKGQ